MEFLDREMMKRFMHSAPVNIFFKDTECSITRMIKKYWLRGKTASISVNFRWRMENHCILR